MPRSSYLGLARLGTHPAFRWSAAALVCPYAECRAEPFTRFSEYDRHFLTHEPAARMAFWWMSARTYDRLAARRGWPTGDEALEQWGGEEPLNPELPSLGDGVRIERDATTIVAHIETDVEREAPARLDRIAADLMRPSPGRR